MGWIGTAGAVFAWFMKVMLLFVGLVFLFMPGYALYFRPIGVVILAVSLLTFRTTQARLLRERGIRIPTAVVAVLLIGSLFMFAAVVPSDEDLEVSDERAELTDGTLSFSMNVTNTADGPVTNTDMTFYVNSSGRTIATTTLEEQEFDRGETRSFEVELLSLSELSESDRAAIEAGEYEIAVVFDEDTRGTTHTPASVSPGVTLTYGSA